VAIDSKREVENTEKKAEQVLTEAKQKITAELGKSRADINQSLADMEAKRKDLEELARQAGINIIETDKEISRIVNSRPRKGRGRRNN